MTACWTNVRNWLAVGLVAGSLVVTGCGRSPPKETSSGEEEEAEVSGEGGSESEETTSGKTVRRKPKKKTRKTAEGPHIGDIPLDAFGDQPIVASNAVAAASAGPGKTEPAKAEPAPMANSTESSAPSAAPAGGGGWDQFLSKDVITAEVKQVRLKMKDVLSAVTKYNGAYKKAIPECMSTLAALAIIVGEAPLDVSWKADAKYVRDMAAEVQAKASGLGDQNYQATQKAWEQLDDLLNGNKPPKLPDGPDKLLFSDVVKRGAAMRRMDEASGWLKSNIGSADALKKEQDRAVQEASILATMTRIIGTEGYDSADDDNYKKFVAAMEKAALEVVNAAKNNDFAALNDGQSRGLKTCGECHTEFKP